MSETKSCPAGGNGGAGGGHALHGVVVQPHSTTGAGENQATAVWHLARLLAGAADADLEAIRAAWPDAPLDGGRPDLAILRAWLEGRPETLDAVLRIDPSAPPPAPAQRTTWTAAELLAATFPEPRWLVPGLLPEGLTLLAGRPKLGKSWLALQIACAVGTGGHALGQAVASAEVLYLALEDAPRRIQARMRAQCWPATARVRFEFSWPDLVHEGGLGPLQDILTQRGYGLVVVDTLSRAARYDQNDVAEATAVLATLQRLALERGAAIVCVDHHRKPAGSAVDLVDDLLGSTAKAATADCLWALYRERGKRGAVLKVTGRDVDDRELAVEWHADTCAWQALGEAGDVARQESRQRVLQALADLGGAATTAEIADHLNGDRGNVSRALADLYHAHRVVRDKRDGRWWALPAPADTTVE